MKRDQVLLQAIAFGFGPASQAAAIAYQLRDRKEVDKGVEIIGLGHSVAYGFLQKSGMFDRVIHWDSLSGNLPDHVRRIVNSAQAVLSVGDFDFAAATEKAGRRPAFVDALYWMWDQDPIDAALCDPYYAVDFPGVAKRLDEHHARWRENGNPKIVNPICLPFKENRHQGDSTSGVQTVIINFGGLVTPFGVNLEAAIAMTQEILKVLSNGFPNCRVLVTGGSPAIEQIGASLPPTLMEVQLGPFPASEFLLELVHSAFIFTVPSISIGLEVAATGAPAFFLLPVNYSQHLQQAIFRKILQGPGYSSWDDFEGYKNLLEGAPEHEGVAEALNLGRRFAEDPEARARFRKSVEDYVQCSVKPPVRLVYWETDCSEISMDGAAEIASNILDKMKRRKDSGA